MKWIAFRARFLRSGDLRQRQCVRRHSDLIVQIVRKDKLLRGALDGRFMDPPSFRLVAR